MKRNLIFALKHFVLDIVVLKIFLFDILKTGMRKGVSAKIENFQKTI